MPPSALRLRIIALLLAVVLTACHRGATDQTAYMRSMRLPPSPTPFVPWPEFRATNYDKPGQPALTKKQTALIRYTLSLLKPCQAALLRYAFPDPSWGTSPHYMVLYFWRPDEDHSWPLILWERDGGYKPAVGQAFTEPDADFPEPKWRGTAYEVVHQSCHPSD